VSRIEAIAIAIVLGACWTSPQGQIEHRGSAAVTTERSGPEWTALARLAAGDGDALGTLSELYTQLRAWDEYSVVRAQMLALSEFGLGPAPGGPFPRIGAPRADAVPVTVLGRWLNRRDVPELYAAKEVTPRELEAVLQAKLTGGPEQPRLLFRLAGLSCIQLKFRPAIDIYKEVLKSLAPSDPLAVRTRALLADVRAIVRSE
jgi:hypothetical protein